MGVNLINLPGDVTSPTEYITPANLIFNSVLSTKNTRFMCEDIANFYFKVPMDIYDYIKQLLYIIP